MYSTGHRTSQSTCPVTGEQPRCEDVTGKMVVKDETVNENDNETLKESNNEVENEHTEDRERLESDVGSEGSNSDDEADSVDLSR